MTNISMRNNAPANSARNAYTSKVVGTAAAGAAMAAPLFAKFFSFISAVDVQLSTVDS